MPKFVPVAFLDHHLDGPLMLNTHALKLDQKYDSLYSHEALITLNVWQLKMKIEIKNRDDREIELSVSSHRR